MMRIQLRFYHKAKSRKCIFTAFYANLKGGEEMRKKKKPRQLWQQPYQRLLIEVTIILVIWTVAQGDPHHIIPSLLHLLSSLS